MMALRGWYLLWLVDDNPKRTWPQKIASAAKRHREKFGCPVEVVYIHNTVTDAPDHWTRPDGVEIPVLTGAQPSGHIFLCAAQEQEAEAG